MAGGRDVLSLGEVGGLGNTLVRSEEEWCTTDK